MFVKIARTVLLRIFGSIKMKALITKTSDWKYKEVREIKSIDDIINIYRKLVITKIDDNYLEIIGEKYKDCDIEIEIYDDWRE